MSSRNGFSISLFSALKTSYQIVRALSETRFGGLIVHTDFNVFSCSDDVISPPNVKDCTCTNPEHYFNLFDTYNFWRKSSGFWL